MVARTTLPSCPRHYLNADDSWSEKSRKHQVKRIYNDAPKKKGEVKKVHLAGWFGYIDRDNEKFRKSERGKE